MKRYFSGEVIWNWKRGLLRGLFLGLPTGLFLGLFTNLNFGLIFGLFCGFILGPLHCLSRDLNDIALFARIFDFDAKVAYVLFSEDASGAKLTDLPSSDLRLFAVLGAPEGNLSIWEDEDAEITDTNVLRWHRLRRCAVEFLPLLRKW